jgi:hypothetical protein
MKSNGYVHLALITMIGMQMAGCASSRAPGGWLPDPADRHSLTYGGWISVRLIDRVYGWDAEGELIAVDNDSLYIWSDFYEFGAIPLNKIHEAQLTAYDIKASQLATWTLLGILTTPSHGFILIISAPAWLLLGAIPTAAQSYTPQIKYPSKTWNEFRKFARFPQGLPQGFKGKIKPKIKKDIRY